jgi:hypothetical protein
MKTHKKFFKPTQELILELKQGGEFFTRLKVTNHKGKVSIRKMPIKIVDANKRGIHFEIRSESFIDVQGVQYPNGYGLLNSFRIFNEHKQYYVPKNSVKNFKSQLTDSHTLTGRISNLSSSRQKAQSYHRAIIGMEEEPINHPTDFIENTEAFLKFDYGELDTTTTMLGIEIPMRPQTFVKLNINNVQIHFYSIPKRRVHIIEGIDKCTILEFQKIADAIRLSYGLLCGEYHDEEVTYIHSSNRSFNSKLHLTYQEGSGSYLSKYQILNYRLFWEIFEKSPTEQQEEWKDYYGFMHSSVFSRLSQQVYDDKRISRGIKLILLGASIANPIEKGAIYSIALETLTTATTSIDSKRPKPISDIAIWKNLREKLRTKINQFESEIGNEAFQIISSRIDNLNSPSNRNKLRLPFDQLGIKLNEIEEKILEQRNQYLHGSETVDEGLFKDEHLNSLRMHNMLGILLLKYVGYKGHYINISGSYVLENKELSAPIFNLDVKDMPERIKRIESYKDVKDLSTIDLEQFEEDRTFAKNLSEFALPAYEVSEMIRII